MFKCRLLKCESLIKSSRVPLVNFGASLQCEIRGFHSADENYVSNFWLTIPYSLTCGYELAASMRKVEIASALKMHDNFH
jgi:hypothetical protein